MYLLDTHVLICFLCNDPVLPVKTTELIGKSRDAAIFVSIASFWEMAIKSSKDKLTLPCSITDLMSLCADTLHLSILVIKDVHLETLRILPWIHKDPFDRLMISQAISEDLALITADEQIDRYPVRRVWVI